MNGRNHYRTLAWGLMLTGVTLSQLWSRPPGLPRLRRGEDVEILDDRYLGGEQTGWTVPPDYDYSFQPRRYGAIIPGEIYSGRFGQPSGKLLYTTWRPTEPLSDEIYAAGKTTIHRNHVSELVTPPFEVTLDYVTFLLSGGNMPNEACVNLLVDGEVVRTATGRNDDFLEWVAFDVKDLRGKEARVQVLDTSTATMGYITVDCICQSPDPKSATRIIETPPAAANGAGGRVETIAGQIAGSPKIKDGALRVGEQVVTFDKVLQWDMGIDAMDAPAGNRLELVNGELLAAEVLGLKEDELLIRHSRLGEMRIPVTSVAQALFQPGPAVEAEPGTLIHSNGNKIPGELLWIRDDNISIKCSLGVIPLPKGRVRAFVFSKRKPAKTAVDTVMLSDGSTLTGRLSLDKEQLLLAHDALGSLKLAASDVSRVTRSLEGVTPLASLEGELVEQVGPIPPPAPIRVDSESGEALRMFPRTAMRYKLPEGKSGRRFRANIAPLANSDAPMTAFIRAGGTEKRFMIPPDGSGVEVDVDLGSAAEIEIVADSAGTISYPCGIELRNAFIVEGQTS